MKRSIKRVSALILMLLSVATVRAQESFSLEEAIQYALENNENLKIAKVNTIDAEAQVGETRADGLPQVNANFGYTNNTQIPVNIVPANVFDPNAPEGATAAIRFGVQHQSNFGVTASQMIWDGSFFIGLKAAKMLREKVVVDEQKARQDVVEQVTKAYYMVLVNQVRTDLINANIATLESTLKDTRALYENGFAEKIDVSRLQVQLNNLKAEMSGVDQAIQASKNLLKLSMGMAVDTSISLSEELDAFDFEYSAAEIDAYVVADRLELQQVEYLKRLAELDIKNVYSQYIPKVTFNAAWGRNSGTDIFSNLWNDQRRWFTNSNIGLNVSIPVFDGLRKKYTVERKKYQLETLNYQYSQLSNNLRQELINAKTSLDVNLERLSVQEDNMELAQEVADVTRAKYTEGVGSNLELIDAEQSRKVAEVNYLTALYDAIVAKIDLDKALGKLN
ncbi:TolC family protein [Roseivirga sp.]|uniref:TolC family protein n=1 Tax=Roseivirga sp. TaxID=1964215 RepID=UPI003B52FF0B